MGLLLISPGKVPVFSMVLPCFAKPWIILDLYMKPSTDEPPNCELRLYVLAELLVVHLLPETHGMMSWCQRDVHFPVHWEILRKCCVCCEGVATTTTTLWRLKTFGTALRFTQGSMPIPMMEFQQLQNEWNPPRCEPHDHTPCLAIFFPIWPGHKKTHIQSILERLWMWW